MKRYMGKFFNSALNQHKRILFLTNSGNNTEGFYHTIKSSTVLDFNPDRGLLFKPNLKEKPYLIYVGDFANRTIGDLELALMLLQLKKEYPDQVYLLAGTRDIAKSSAFSLTFGEYLKHAQVGVVIPEAKLIAVHGGLHQENIGRLPNMRPEDYRIENAGFWIKRLNESFQRQIEEWVRQSSTESSKVDSTKIGKPEPKQVFASNDLSFSRKFKTIPYALSEYLQNNELQIALLAPQRLGDNLSLTRDKSVVFINGDSGYSNTQDQKNDCTKTFDCLEIVTNNDHVRVEMKAVLSNAIVNAQLGVYKRFITGNPEELAQRKQQEALDHLVQRLAVDY